MNSDTRMPAALRSRIMGASACAVTGHVQTAFGRALFPALGHDAGGMRPVAQRYRQHLRCGGHFQVQRQVDLVPQPLDVAVGDVAPVFPQMGGDAVGSGLRRGAAARTGSGCGPPRALRIVATWSMFTPRRRERFMLQAPACGAGRRKPHTVYG